MATFPIYNLTDLEKKTRASGMIVWLYTKGEDIQFMDASAGWTEDVEKGILYNIHDPSRSQLKLADKVNAAASTILKMKSPSIQPHPTSILINQYHKDFIQQKNINLSNLLRSMLDYIIANDLL